MKKTLAFGIVLLFLFCNISFTTMSNENSGNLSGKTLYVGGSGPGNYTKIQDAINDSSDGDTVFVYNGTYNGGLLLNKSINLNGENRDNTIIDGKIFYPEVILITIDNCSVSNFTIRNGIFSNIEIWSCSCNNIIKDNIIEKARVSGLYIRGGNNLVRNNLIKDNNYRGIYLFSHKNSICDNIIMNNKRGIQLRHAENFIYNNQFYNDGIYVYYFENMAPPYPNYVFNNAVNGKKLVYLENEKNKIIGNEAGQVFLIDCENITIKNNEIEKVHIGIHIFQCNEISITGNYIHSVGSRGIYISHGNNIVISDNINIDNGHIALLINDTEKIFIEGNNLSNNYDGIYLGMGCSNTKISNNVISSNQHSNIMVVGCLNTKISGNQIVNYKPTNGDFPSGINVGSSSFTEICKNNIIGNYYGVFLYMDTYFTSIKQNNIYENKIDSSFMGEFFSGSSNKWQNNYWGENIFPKLIVGLKFLIYPVFTIPWINFDWLPAQEPYDIPILEV